MNAMVQYVMCTICSKYAIGNHFHSKNYVFAPVQSYVEYHVELEFLTISFL